MKVQPHALEAYANSTVSRAHDVRPAAGQSASRTQKTDDSQAAYLSISSEARMLAAASVDKPVDTQKVSALRAKIDAGELQVDPEAIASRILDRLA